MIDEGDRLRRDIIWGAVKAAGYAFMLGVAITLRVLALFAGVPAFSGLAIFTWLAIIGLGCGLYAEAHDLWNAGDQAAAASRVAYGPRTHGDVLGRRRGNR